MYMYIFYNVLVHVHYSARDYTVDTSDDSMNVILVVQEWG